MTESVIVVSRFRQEFNKAPEEYEPWEFQPEVGYIKHIGKQKEYNFDYALTTEVDQEFMYEKAAKKQIGDFVSGINVTIFAYGKTGSGKTFSMTGPETVTDSLKNSFTDIPESTQKLFGIIPRACLQIFQGINDFIRDGCQCKLTASYCEVYMEKIYDLLTKDRKEITLKYLGGMYLMDKLTKRECMTPEEIFGVISEGTGNKKTAATAQNARSSRSHTILTIELEKSEISGTKTNSKLFLVDLAGSERQSKTHAEGTTKEEGIKINLSLTCLGCVIFEISRGKGEVPIRLKDSKLTMILKESFLGNCRLTLLVTASILAENADEAVNSLDFAKRAKMIKKKVTKNVLLSPAELEYLSSALKEEILNLRGQLIKAGLSYVYLKDKKILDFLKNEEYNLEGKQSEDKPKNMLETEDSTNTSSTSETAKFDLDSKNQNKLELGHGSSGKGDLMRRKRMSIVDLDEEGLIMKYCELRAKFENLEQATRNKLIYDHSKESQAENMIDDVKNEASRKLTEIDENRLLELSELKEKLEKEKDDYIKTKSELEKKIGMLEAEKFKLEDEVTNVKRDLDGIQEFANLVENDNATTQEKLEKKRKKYKNIKEKFASVTNEKEEKNKEINELLTNFNLVKLEKIQMDQDMENIKTQNDLLKNEIQTINETLSKNIQNSEIDSKNVDKLYQDLLQKDALNETRLKNEEQKSKVYEEKNAQLTEENNNLRKDLLDSEQKERNHNEKIAGLNDALNEKLKLIADIQDSLKERDEKIESLKANTESKQEIEKVKKENQELRDEFIKLQLEIQHKSKAVNDVEIKLKETKTEYIILQNSHQRLTRKVADLELELESLKKKSMLNRNSIIKEKVNLDKSKNIFGFILKKTDNSLIKKEIEKHKQQQNIFEEMNKDRIDMLKHLRANIISLSPKTVSSRSSITDLPEIDFNDDEAFDKIQKEREDHEKEREARKKMAELENLDR